MDPDYIEALLTWNERGPADAVHLWLVAQGFTVTPMRAGLLVAGTRERFETVFGLALTNVSPPLTIPMPPDRRDHVASFTIPKLRRFT